jgi:hypothetical protein
MGTVIEAPVGSASLAGIEDVRGVGPFLTDLRADLKARRFTPLPVRERMIPKSSGKLRRLGIPTVRDRVVQAALKLVLEPIFEADFQPCSHGFRPRHRAQDAQRARQVLALADVCPTPELSCWIWSAPTVWRSPAPTCSTCCWTGSTNAGSTSTWCGCGSPERVSTDRHTRAAWRGPALAQRQPGGPFRPRGARSEVGADSQSEGSKHWTTHSRALELPDSVTSPPCVAASAAHNQPASNAPGRQGPWAALGRHRRR